MQHTCSIESALCLKSSPEQLKTCTYAWTFFFGAKVFCASCKTWPLPYLSREFSACDKQQKAPSHKLRNFNRLRFPLRARTDIIRGLTRGNQRNNAFREPNQPSELGHRHSLYLNESCYIVVRPKQKWAHICIGQKHSRTLTGTTRQFKRADRTHSRHLKYCSYCLHSLPDDKKSASSWEKGTEIASVSQVATLLRRPFLSFLTFSGRKRGLCQLAGSLSFPESEAKALPN